MSEMMINWLATLVIVAALAGMGSLYYDTVVVGNYLATAGVFVSVFVVAAPFAAVYFGFQLLRSIWTRNFSYWTSL